MTAATRWAVVTGCGIGGIGHNFTLQLVNRGINVVATLLPFEERQHLDLMGVHVVNLDVTSQKQVDEFCSTVDGMCDGRLDFLFNNAGIIYTMPATDTDVAQAEKMFGVNVFGPMRLVGGLHRQLIRARGVVVNTSSIGGVCPFVYGAAYNASKAALVQWADTLRVEMGPLGVRVMNVISGEIATGILRRDAEKRLPEGSVYAPLAEQFKAHVTRIPPGRTPPDEYARNVVREATERRRPAAWLWTGHHALTIRLMAALLPRSFFDWWFTSMFGLSKLAAGTKLE